MGRGRSSPLGLSSGESRIPAFGVGGFGVMLLVVVMGGRGYFPRGMARRGTTGGLKYLVARCVAGPLGKGCEVLYKPGSPSREVRRDCRRPQDDKGLACRPTYTPRNPQITPENLCRSPSRSRTHVDNLAIKPQVAPHALSRQQCNSPYLTNMKPVPRAYADFLSADSRAG